MDNSNTSHLDHASYSSRARSPRLSLHTQLFQETLPAITFSTTLNLTLTLTGHDTGSDALELKIVWMGSTAGGGFLIGFNRTDYQMFPTATNLFLTPSRFIAQCNSVNSCATTIHYSPISDSLLVLLNEANSPVTIVGRHTWTVTTVS